MRTSARCIVALAALSLCRSAIAADVVSEPYTWKSVTILANGFINGVVYNPADGGACYINTDMGGAYRLDAAKNEWVCLTDWIANDDWSLNQMGVETLAVDPTDANRVYAGLGTYMGPSAIVRSTDQGRTWQRTNVPFGMNGNGSARNSGQRMNVDPNLPSTLLYGTRTKGLFESTDYGATWNAVAAFPATGDTSKPLKETGLTWTLFDKASGKPSAATPVAFVGVCTEQADKIYRTLDAGKTWQPMPGQPGGRLLPTRAVLTPDGSTLYCTFVTAKQYPGPWGIDGGALYQCKNPAAANPVWTNVTPAEGGGWSGISLDPTSPTTVYASSINRYAPHHDDIFRSTDAGESWTGLEIGKHRDDRSAPYIQDAGIHWTGDVEVNPHNANEAMFTTGYGLYRTTDLRSAEPTWVFYNQGFEQSAALELISPKAGTANLISAIGDRDGYRHEDFAVSPKYGRLGQKNDYGQTESLSMGTCNDIDVAWNDSNIAVRVGSGAQFSNDGGITWHTFPGDKARNGFAEEGAGERGPKGGSVAVTADGRTAVWSPESGHGAMMAVRNGKEWSPWQSVPSFPPGRAMLAADPGLPETVYARTPSGFYASTNGGRSFARRDAESAGRGPNMLAANWLRATPGHAGHLWLTAGDEGKDGLWHSTDGGRAWVRVAADVVTTAKQVGVGAPPPGKDYAAIYVGGTVGGLRGFFRSDDQGRTWVRVNDDAHQYGNVTVINGDSRIYGRLYVGTNGRGILYAEPTKAASLRR
ncbi:MAG: carbohydrate-binding protein [Phycisphaerales bacterium]|nr:carbohydrate-binding protein [Phycisphaerales bacterium]